MRWFFTSTLLLCMAASVALGVVTFTRFGRVWNVYFPIILIVIFVLCVSLIVYLSRRET